MYDCYISIKENNDVVGIFIPDCYPKDELIKTHINFVPEAIFDEHGNPLYVYDPVNDEISKRDEV